MANESTATAWIAFSAAMLALVATVGMQVWDRQQQRQHEILLKREAALFRAVRVIDNVYANTEFSGRPHPPRRDWDIQEARDAMYGMVIYCKDPDKTVQAFFRAIGTHDVNAKKAPYDVGMLNDFLTEVARELDLPEIKWRNPSQAWIESAPGSKEGLELQGGRTHPASEHQ
ncbi:MAG TPA: hypothetical protein VFI02_19515 [Armatimonadota bacterium]|nr:hypothetical protein [Armatimonadota bacterium]